MAGNFLGFGLPFGQSNRSNPTPVIAEPAKNQLDPKNTSTDPRNQSKDDGGNPDPSNNADPAKGQDKGSHLDAYKDLFTIPTDKDGNPIQSTDPLKDPIFNVDPAKMREAVGKMNLAGSIQPELLQKAMSGQDPQAFIQVLNAVAQNAVLTSMQANTGVVSSAFERHTQRLDAALPERIRNVQISNAGPKHPALSHPAVAPILAGLKNQIATTNPHLSPDKVAEMAENYVIAMRDDMNTVDQQQQQQQDKSKSGNATTDWLTLLKA